MKELGGLSECIVSKYRDMNVPLDMEKLTILLTLCQILSVKRGKETIFTERIMSFTFCLVVPELLHMYGIGSMSEDVREKNVVLKNGTQVGEEVKDIAAEVVTAVSRTSTKLLSEWFWRTMPRINEKKCFDEDAMREWNTRNELSDLKDFVNKTFREATTKL